ncbi:MAG: aspartate aminotransferase family protein [Dehalococcoidia bacterium]|nr:aspartate aminotransferase family protein [Dehalococcoidia bacterium]
MTDKIYSGEEIEELRSLAADHLFMHAMQTNDWIKGGLQMFVSGNGCWVNDVEGQKYLDMMGGLWYKSAGYGQQKIADAAYKQISDLSSPPAYSTTPSTVKLSAEIASLYQDKKCRTFFTSGGSESVETAVKMAKKYQQLNGKPKAFKIISRRFSYHGSTAMAVSLGRASYSDPMGPEVAGVVYVPHYDSYRPPIPGNPSPDQISEWLVKELETTIIHNDPDTVAAFIAEPVSTSSGIHLAPESYWQGIREITKKYGVLMIADEVITGYGRLGEWFGTMVWDVKPDITTTAKALTSGYIPLGAVIASEKVANAFIGGKKETFSHLLTFGGHPVATAAALANLEVMKEQQMVKNSKDMGTYLIERLEDLREFKHVGDVRGGKGLLAVVELVKNKKSKEKFGDEIDLYSLMPKFLRDKGLLSYRAGDMISICPPLMINKDEIDFIVEGIKASIEDLESHLSSN